MTQWRRSHDGAHPPGGGAGRLDRVAGRFRAGVEEAETAPDATKESGGVVMAGHKSNGRIVALVVVAAFGALLWWADKISDKSRVERAAVEAEQSRKQE